MVLLLVSIGFLAGATAALAAFLGGGGLAVALLAYAGFALVAVIATALLAGLVGIWRAEPVAPPVHPAFTPAQRG